MDESNGKHQSGGFFAGCGVGKNGETYISECAPVSLGKLEVNELRTFDAGACYALGVMAGTAARELSDGAMVDFNWALGVVRDALGIEIGEKHEV